MQDTVDLFEFAFTAIFSEAFSMGFLVAFVVFALGCLLLVLFAATRCMGYRTVGVVLGAVQEIRIKQKSRDGEQVEKRKTSVFPVYEYRSQSGETRIMRGSEGGSFVAGYATGQHVELIVREARDYDDVYDAEQKGALFLGLAFAATGAGLMAWIGSLAASFGLTITALLVLGIARIAISLAGHKNKLPKRRREPYGKKVCPEDIVPIEELSASRSNRVSG
ncbi:MAG: DUF3592 domain-containing protein [Pseudomonadota bacterium]